MDHPRPWLKYVEADAIGNDELKGLAVESPTGEALGEVEGFIVDSLSAWPYYVVVDAGGWFKSKHFLLPIGHAKLISDVDRDALEADLTRDNIDRFPGFDLSEFDRLTPDSVKELNNAICEACGAEPGKFGSDEPLAAAWDRADYRKPDWWHAEPSLPERMGASAQKEMVDYPPR